MERHARARCSSRGTARCAASPRTIRPPPTSRSCSPRTCPTTLAEDPALAARVQRRSRERSVSEDRELPGAVRLLRERRRRPARRLDRRSPVAHRRRRAPHRQPRRARRRDRRGHAPRHRRRGSPAASRSAACSPASRRSAGSSIPTRRARPMPAQPCPTVDVSTLTLSHALHRRVRRGHVARRAEHRGRRRPALGADVGRHRAALLERARAAARRRAGIRSAAAARACGRAWAAASRCCRPGSATTVIRRDAHRRRRRRRRSATSRVVETGAAFAVAPDIEPIAQDELTAGVEVALAQRGARDACGCRAAGCARGLETTPDGFDNPGRDGGDRRRSATPSCSPPSSRPRRPASSRSASATCTAARSARGPAPFDPRQGAVLYDGTDYDARRREPRRRAADRHRPPRCMSRPSARPGRPGRARVATRLTVASGRPRRRARRQRRRASSTCSRAARPAAARCSRQANVRLAATLARLRHHARPVQPVRPPRRRPNVDEVYASGAIRPIDGGTLERPRVPARPRPGAPRRAQHGFGVPTAFQAPFSAVLGIHHAF